MDKISFKQNLVKFYNQEAALRDSKSVKEDWKTNVREQFLTCINQEDKKSLLELGAGPGHDSQFFVNNGLSVVAVDLSAEMVMKCKEKGIEAYELDFYHLSSLNQTFDCIYAINTLLHVPKTDLCHVLSEIDAVLNPNGLFYMGLYGGEDTESDFVKSEVSDAPRLFSLYSKRYLETTLDSYFQILEFETLDVGTETEINIFHSITMRKK